MKPRLVAVVVAWAVLLSTRAPHAASDAASDAERARRAAVVARIGPRSVTVGELEDRLAALPRFQLVTFGATPDAIRRKFLDDVIVPEVLLSLGAEERHLDRELPTEHRIARTLSEATLRVVRGALGPPSAIPMDEVRRFYDENRLRFDAPERLHLWRILCKTRDDAAAVIDAMKKDGTVANFTTLARDRSIDKATNLRGGELGFVAPDGSSNEAGVKVDPSIVKAARAVKDGEIVPQPIEEQGYFAVVWRRGAIAASHRTVDEVAPQIREILWRQKRDEAEKKEIDALRARELHEVNDALLQSIDVSPGDGAIVPRRRPGQVAPLQPIGKPTK